MPTLKEIDVEICNAVIDFKLVLKVSLVLAQSLLPHIRRIPDHHIESPVLTLERLRKLQLPVEEPLLPRQRLRPS